MERSAGSVLVVDDTVANLRLLSDLLGQHGYDMRAATSGRQAIQAAEGDPPDLILLDIAMPGMDGYEVCRRLKASDATKHVPVIFLTALTETADKVRAFDAGCVDYVTKPFQIDEVLARVRTHVALNRAQTALSESYERLRALEQFRDDLVHMVVHDMRSPLTVMQTNLALLKGPVAALGEASREDLQAAADASRALLRMANDLLDVSRLEQGGMPVELAQWDLAQMARDVRGVLQPLDAARPIQIESHDVAFARCDGGLVRRVLENLIANGIRHTPAGSRMRIDIVRADGRVRVVVHDEGPGVPPDARTKIFEKFGTVAVSHEGAYHSAGLGLAFCKLAIEAQGGAIGVDPGVPTGSQFWFDLPA